MNQRHNYCLFYRKVKYLRIEVSKDIIRLIVPQKYPVKIDDVIERKKGWIQSKVEQLRELEDISRRLSLYNCENLEEIVERNVNEYGSILRVMPEKIFFRRMKNRWGSCHFRNKKLIFNRRLKFLPEELIRYVVLHEMCHLIVKNHRKEFWLLVKKLDERYEEKERLLLCYNLKLMEEQNANLKDAGKETPLPL